MTTTQSETLGEALERVYRDNWQHKRSGKVLYAQAKAAIHTPPFKPGYELAWFGLKDIQTATAFWYTAGLSPATIQKRLSCLKTLGVNVEGVKNHVPKQLKWHLREDMKEPVRAWLCDRAGGGFIYTLTAFYIEAVTLTGLRVEEALELHWGDLTAVMNGNLLHNPRSFTAITISGTKTQGSQATLPVGPKVSDILVDLWYRQNKPAGTSKVFNVTYESLKGIWDEVRENFGWQDDPTATLKALRRSAARYLHVDCGMPLHMVQQYLRHSNMATTLEYLRLTGGYGTEEMRRYLK